MVIQNLVLVQMPRVSYAATRDGGVGPRAAATVRTVCRSIRELLQSIGATRRGQPVPGRALQRQRAEVHAGDAWAAPRPGQLRSAAALHHRFAVGGRADVGAAAGARARAPRCAGARRHQLPQTGPALGRGETPVLRSPRQDCQLSGRGVDGAARRSARVAAHVRVVFAAGVGRGHRATRKGRDSRPGPVSREVAHGLGAHPPRGEGWVSADRRPGRCGLRLECGVSPRGRTPRPALRPRDPRGVDDVDATGAARPPGGRDRHPHSRASWSR